MIDISRKTCSNCSLHLFISCEGGFGYELELRNNAIHSTRIKAMDCEISHMKNYFIHKTWIYPDLVTCSCSSLQKAVSVLVGEQLIIIMLMNGLLYLCDSQGNRYQIGICESISDLNVYHMVNKQQQSRIVLLCRDLSFLHVYTDIWRYYQYLSWICLFTHIACRRYQMDVFICHSDYISSSFAFVCL